MDEETKMAAGRMALGGVGVTIYGFTLNEVVAICTIIYMLVQIIILMPKFIQTVRGWFS